MQDILVGSREFDDAFVIQSNNEETLKKILSPKAMKQILSIGDDITVSISDGVLVMEMIRSIDQKFLALKLIRTYGNIYREMYDLNFATSGLELKFVESKTITCMVCGETIATNKVNCIQCDTAHHKDCWEYLGMCSTFACGCKRLA